MRSFIIAIVLGMSTAIAGAEEVTLVSDLIQQVRALKSILPEDLASRLQHEFDDKSRVTWSFFPGEHPGLPLSACNEEQQQAMLGCVRLALSVSGFAKTELVRTLDDVLAEEAPDRYSSASYFLSVWGEPGEMTPWSLRWEGHHLSLNWLIKDGRVMASTPQFVGSNPARVLDGPLKDTRAQSEEEDKARALVKALDETQQAKAIVSGEAIGDIITHMKSDAASLGDEGIPYTDLSADQQAQLRGLIQIYIELQAAPIAETRARALSDESLSQVRFAWYGGVEPGEKHYYRIQGSGWVIEYANTQNDANHIHTTWRDFTNDFGRDMLREHLAAFHGPEAILPW